MAPASIVLRLTPQLVAGYDTYGFTPTGGFPEIIEGPGNSGDFADREQEFYMTAGKIVKDMPAEDSEDARG